MSQTQFWTPIDTYWESVEATARFTGADPTDIHHLERGAEFLIDLPKSAQSLRIRPSHGQGDAL